MTALLAALGLAPARAADDTPTDPSATQPGATEQQEPASGGASAAPTEGQDVRASYQEKSDDPKASRTETKGEDASTVHVMAPTDPDWNETHQGG